MKLSDRVRSTFMECNTGALSSKWFEQLADQIKDLEEYKKQNRRISYSKAKRAIEIFENEYMGRDHGKLWEDALKEALNGE